PQHSPPSPMTPLDRQRHRQVRVNRDHLEFAGGSGEQVEGAWKSMPDRDDIARDDAAVGEPDPADDIEVRVDARMPGHRTMHPAHADCRVADAKRAVPQSLWPRDAA